MQYKPSAVIIELEDWLTRCDMPGRYEGLIERQGAQVLHPSDQVRGYAEYCRRFHSAVSDHAADVHGCVFFTRDEWASVYSSPPNDNLVRMYPLFTTAQPTLTTIFPNIFLEKLLNLTNGLPLHLPPDIINKTEASYRKSRPRS